MQQPQQDFDFRELNWDDVTRHTSVVYNGRSKSGKTTLMYWHAYQLLKSEKHNFSTAMVFCPNKKVRDMWARRVPASWLHSGWSESTLQAELQRRKRRADEGKDVRSMLFVADDCSFDTKFLNSSLALEEAMKVGRNYKMTRLVACQWILDLKPALREQFEVYCFPKTNQLETIKKVHKYYGGPIGTPSLFHAIFRRLTRNWGCMCIYQNPQAEKVTDEIFWARAMPDLMEEDERKHGREIIGRDAYWAMHACYYSQKLLTDPNASYAPKSGQPIRMVGERRHPTTAGSVMCV